MLIIGGIILWLVVVIMIITLFVSAKGEDTLRFKSHFRK
jgi:hypothetical protein